MVNQDGNHRERVVAEWSRVERISFGRVEPSDKEGLLEFVEQPLKEAVGILYDKNIQTIGSSCNINDFARGRAWISLDGRSLSDANQAVVDRYKHHERTSITGMDVPIVGLFLPISEYESPWEVGKKAGRLAEKFHEQPFSWVKKWTIAQAREYFEHPEVDTRTCSSEELVQLVASSGYYFDEASGTFYYSEEQCLKAESAPTE